jgi:hypothetical protein
VGVAGGCHVISCLSFLTGRPETSKWKLATIQNIFHAQKEAGRSFSKAALQTDNNMKMASSGLLRRVAC